MTTKLQRHLDTAAAATLGHSSRSDTWTQQPQRHLDTAAAATLGHSRERGTHTVDHDGIQIDIEVDREYDGQHGACGREVHEYREDCVACAQHLLRNLQRMQFNLPRSTCAHVQSQALHDNLLDNVESNGCPQTCIPNFSSRELFRQTDLSYSLASAYPNNFMYVHISVRHMTASTCSAAACHR
jgi:hypothetical protein